MAWIIFFHGLTFLLFWLTNLSFKQEVNDFLAEMTGLSFDFLLNFILLTLALGLWSVARLISRRKAKIGSGWPYIVVAVIYLLFFYGSFTILFFKNPVQIPRLGQLISYFRFFLDAVLLFLVAWGVRLWLKRSGNSWQKGLASGGIIFLWLIPVFWTPGAVYRSSLPEKPLLMAHRGASTLAPENTLAAMERAAQLGVYGLEADITVSRDGILFLMHDSTLARTTDAAKVYPERRDTHADSFKWEELERLSAGQWFVEQDPFGTIASGLVSTAQAASYKIEPIPTLAEMLQIVRDNELHFIYDLRIPSAEHPFAGQARDLCLAELQEAGVSARTWVLVSTEEIPVVRAILPEAILAKGLDYEQNPPSPGNLLADGYQLVNSEYGLSNSKIHAFRKAGLWVNLWTVDESWQYSRLWLAGADSVTSNNVQGLIAMSRPVMSMSYPLYLIVWGLVGIVALGFVLLKSMRR